LEQRKATLVGFISSVMIILIGALILWKSDIRFRAGGYKLVCSFTHVGGLIKGSEVRYRGYSVGRVSEIKPGPLDIRVDIWVKRDVAVPKGSTVRVLFDGLVGENYIAIDPNMNSEELMDHGEVIYGSSGSDLAEFIDLGSQNMVHAEAILNSLRSLITDEQTLTSIQRIINNADKLSFQILTLSEKLNSEVNFKELAEAIKNINQTSLLVQSTTNDLLGDGVIVSDLRGFTSELAAIGKTLSDTSTDIETSFDQETLANLKETIKNINSISHSLDGIISSTFQENSEGERGLKLGGFFDLFTSVDMDTEASYTYSSAERDSNYQANVDFNSGKYFIRTGIGDQTGVNKLQHLQHGIHLSDRLTSRVGYMYDTPGIGVDYQLFPSMELTLDAYDLGNTKVNFFGAYEINKNIDFLYGVKSNQNNEQLNSVDLGTKLSF